MKKRKELSTVGAACIGTLVVVLSVLNLGCWKRVVAEGIQGVNTTNIGAAGVGQGLEKESKGIFHRRKQLEKAMDDPLSEDIDQNPYPPGDPKREEFEEKKKAKEEKKVEEEPRKPVKPPKLFRGRPKKTTNQVPTTRQPTTTRTHVPPPP